MREYRRFSTRRATSKPGARRKLKFVGVAEAEADSEPFTEKMARLTAALEEQFAESAQLEAVIKHNLAWFGGEAAETQKPSRIRATQLRAVERHGQGCRRVNVEEQR